MADNLEIINCPACGLKMKKVYMPHSGVNLDVCIDGCGGIYFDNRELEKFDECFEDITPLVELFKGKTFKKTDESEIRLCPVCNMKMVKHFSSSKHDVEIDDCYSCGGKFLDYSELEKIRQEYTNENARAADVLKELYNVAGIELAKFDIKFMKQKNQNPFIFYKENILKKDK